MVITGISSISKESSVWGTLQLGGRLGEYTVEGLQSFDIPTLPIRYPDEFPPCTVLLPSGITQDEVFGMVYPGLLVVLGVLEDFAVQ